MGDTCKKRLNSSFCGGGVTSYQETKDTLKGIEKVLNSDKKK